MPTKKVRVRAFENVQVVNVDYLTPNLGGYNEEGKR